MYKTHSQLQKVLTGSELAKEYRGFTGDYEELDAAIEELLSSPLYRRAVEHQPYAGQYASALREAMELNREKIAEISAAITSITEAAPEAPGLLKLRSRISREQRTSSKQLEGTISNVEFLSASFRDSFVFTVDQIASSLRKGLAQEQKRLLMTSMAAAAALVLIVLLLSVAVIIRLRRQLGWFRRATQRLSEGDFTHRFPERGGNELSYLAQSLNGFIEEFSIIIRDIKELAQRNTSLHSQVSDAAAVATSSVGDITGNLSDITELTGELVHHLESSSREIHGVTDDIRTLATRIEGQSSSVTQSSSSVEEMTASIENVSSIGIKRKQAADELANIAASTGEKLNQTNQLIEENAGDVNQILEVINIINNVASQTNLLSMNAAIEAAHAGDAGRGFAVVAEEIRNLAETTNTNAKKIKNTINTIADRIGRINEMSGETQEAFRSINRETTHSSESMAEISSSMQELSQGSREIMEAMSSLSQTTQEIQESAERMRDGTVNVNDSLREIRSIGEKVNGEIREIEEETSGVNNSMRRINELHEENHRSIEALFEEIKRFHTEADAAAEAEEIEAGE
jgi:methyl-accepting chemotaxis protein